MFIDQETADAMTSLLTSEELQSFGRVIPLEDLNEMLDHARTCAECAALLRRTASTPPASTGSAAPAASTVVNMQEWLAAKSHAGSKT